MGIFSTKIRKLKEDIERFDREAIEVLHDVKRLARHLRDNKLLPIQGEDDTREKRISFDRLLQEGIKVNGECYIHCRASKYRYTRLIKKLEQQGEEMEESIRRAISG